MRALITGISGFIGSHLAEYLTESGARVHGISRRCAESRCAKTEMILTGDVLDASFLQNAINKVQPSHIFHCAGLLAGKARPRELLNVNVIGTHNLLASVARSRPRPLVIITGSSAVYGRCAAPPIREDSPLNPMTEYSASKAAQEMVAMSQFHAHSVPLIVARIFNLVGPWQPDIFMASSLARQIVAAERGSNDPVRVHHLERRRDYIDVRDAVRACAQLAIQGRPGHAYNICSGISRSVGETLTLLVAQTRANVSIVVEQTGGDAVSVEDHRGSFAKIEAETGWKPQLAFEQSLRDMLDDWRARCGSGGLV